MSETVTEGVAGELQESEIFGGELGIGGAGEQALVGAVQPDLDPRDLYDWVTK